MNNEVNTEQSSNSEESINKNEVTMPKEVKSLVKKLSPQSEALNKDFDNTVNNGSHNSDITKKPFTKDKKHNGFLRNTNRKDKPKENTSSSPIHNNHHSNSNNPNNKAHIKHSQHNPANGQSASNNETSTFPKENLNSPEYYLFSHLRQKTGNHPDKFWQNLHLTLQEKSFLDIKRADMTLVSYAALYESIDIFEKLLNEYGKVIPQEEIETSIFKLSTNKNPLILKYTIDFYNTLYSPSEIFIEGFLKIACKASYREEANKLLINWLAPQMTENNKKTFWHACLENKNICFINLALSNTVLHTYLKDNQSQFENLIVNCGRQHTIKNILNSTVAKEVVSSTLEDSDQRAIPAKTKNSKLKIIDNSTESLAVGFADSSELTTDDTNKSNGPEIIVKRKRKIG